MVTTLAEGSARLLKAHCTPGTAFRKEYLKHAPCLNQVILVAFSLLSAPI